MGVLGSLFGSSASGAAGAGAAGAGAATAGGAAATAAQGATLGNLAGSAVAGQVASRALSPGGAVSNPSPLQGRVSSATDTPALNEGFAQGGEAGQGDSFWKDFDSFMGSNAVRGVANAGDFFLTRTGKHETPGASRGYRGGSVKSVDSPGLLAPLGFGQFFQTSGGRY